MQHVLPLRDVGGHQPPAQQDERHRRHAHGPQPEPAGKDQHREAGQPVAHPPHHRVDERLDVERHVGGHGQVEQLHGGLVDGVAQHLVGAPQHDGGGQRADRQQAHRAQRQRHGHDEEGKAQAHLPQQPSGEDPLQGKRGQAGVDVEQAEKGRQLVASDPRLADDGLELPADDGRRERRQEDHGGDGAQVRRAGNQPEAVAQPRAGVLAVVLAAFLGRGAPAPDAVHQDGGRQQADRHADERGLGAEPRGGIAGDEPADDPAGRGAAADDAEHPLGLARGHHVVGQGPDLGGGDHAEHAHPDVEDRRQPGGVGDVGQVPENQAVEREEHQAAHQQDAHVHPPGHPQVHRDPEPHQGGDGDVGVRQQHRAELVDEQGVADGLADGEAADDEKQVAEKQDSPAKLARPEIEHAFQASQHRAGVGVYPSYWVKMPGTEHA